MTDLGPVQVHLHHGMTGTYPLRVLDVLFCPCRALAVEYGYATPVDLLTGGHRRQADGFASRLRTDGLAAALESARERRELPYDGLATVRVFDGGWLGREKVLFERTDGSTLAVRVHADVDVDAFTDAVQSVLDPYDVTVERRAGAGLTAGVLGR
ncbi:MAG: hypothetical protein ABEJ85_05815 [Haloarculaceae archaeon]